MVTNTTAVAEVVDNGELRDRLGRTITPALRRAEFVAAWRESGMTQAAFARSEGINYTTFCSWVQDQRIAEGEMPSARRAAKKAPRPVVRFAELSVPAVPAMSPASLEVRLPDGTILRGANASDLAKLVQALRGA